EALAAVVVGHADRGVLLDLPPDADAEHDPSGGQSVEGGDTFREHGRTVQWEHHDARAEAHGPGTRGEVREQLQGIGHDRVWIAGRGSCATSGGPRATSSKAG